MHRRHLGAVYTSVDDNAVKGTKTNIVEAAFITCHARLKLYKSLDTLQEQVLYYDTDSVVYRWRPGQPSIATDDVLGALRTMGTRHGRLKWCVRSEYSP